MKSRALKIRSTAILIGYDPEGNCIYSEALDLGDYYDGLHVWDKGENVKKMRLQSMKGYLFNSDACWTRSSRTSLTWRRVFTRRAAPDLRTALSGRTEVIAANKCAGGDGGWRVLFAFVAQWPAAPHHGR